MESGSLKDLVSKYGLPLDVKKAWWYEDYYFHAEKIEQTGGVTGKIYNGGVPHQTKTFAAKEQVTLFHDPKTSAGQDELPVSSVKANETNTLKNGREMDTVENSTQKAVSTKVTPNPNRLDTNKENYIAGVTTLFVKKNGQLKVAHFDRFDVKNNGDVIYVTLEGESTSRFYGFPSSYLFPNKDDARQAISLANEQYNNTTGKSPLIAAFQALQNASEPSQSVTIETEHEKAYHHSVDTSLEKQIQSSKKELQKGEAELVYAERIWSAELIAARENGCSPDEHTRVTLGLKEDRAKNIISREQDNIIKLGYIREKPYFARIDCGANKESLHTAYIGNNEIKGYVVDWRNSEIGNAYYHSDLFLNRDDVFLALKRSISIEHGVFQNYKDEINRYQTIEPDGGAGKDETDYTNNSDELLVKLLKEARSDKKTHDIIKSIQGEQYDIITSDFQQNAVINGCAGSGKTMILYHRLSYMAYNFEAAVKRKFDPKNVYIISPSLYFDSNNNELMKKLAIDKVRQAPFDDQVDFLIDRYCAANNMLPFHYLISTMDADKVGDSVSASMETYQVFSEAVKSIEQDESVRAKYNEWVLGFANSILESIGFEPIDDNILAFSHGEFIQLLGSNSYFHNKVFISKNEPGELIEYYLPSSVTAISYENIACSLNNGNSNSSGNSTRRNSIRKNIALLRASLGLKPKIKLGSEISSEIPDFWNLVNNAKAFEKMLGLITVRNILNCLYQVSNRKNDYILRCLFTAQQQFVNSNKSAIKLYMLRSLSEDFGSIINGDAAIFIDEFQNYSSFELECLKRTFQNPVFNLYGDYDQRIEDKGMDLAENIESLFSPTTFNITVNYRNTRQITAYINKAVHKNMKSIGIDGTVSEIPLENCTFHLQDRTAIICKNIDLVQQYIHGKIDAKQVNDLSLTGEIQDELISLMTVRDCKGLEFETVYVFDFDMSENEKYVAYTRALDNLIVIHDDLKKLKEIEEEIKCEAEKARQEEEKRKSAEEAKRKAEEDKQKEIAKRKAEEIMAIVIQAFSNDADS